MNEDPREAFDRRVFDQLERAGVPFCLIGGVAVSCHAPARYTRDVDVLVMDSRVLQPSFWSGAGLERLEIRQGDGDDPLAGLVRIEDGVRHDVVLGKGYAAQFALDTRISLPGLLCPVASALGLILLKLEAGSPRDAFDIIAILDSARLSEGRDLLPEVEAKLPLLSRDARDFHARLEAFRR